MLGYRVAGPGIVTWVISLCVCILEEAVFKGRGRLPGLDSALLRGREWFRETGEPTF